MSWLPFVGVSTEADGGVDLSRVGQSILSKTLSNTILTDYLAEVAEDPRVRRLRDVEVAAPPNSMAYMKMFTPYMIIARTEDMEVDLARMDEALVRAKGYYELLATSADGSGGRCVLRFNIAAFRNNYGLSDLSRMRLTFHAVLVGQTTEDSLTMNAEMGLDGLSESGTPLTAQQLVNIAAGSSTAGPDTAPDVLDVLDVILAGVEHG